MRGYIFSKKNRAIWLLLLMCSLFFFFRFPSLFEPYWYGDEGIYYVLGRAMDAGRFLYKDIWDNKPPLLYLLYAIFNADQFAIRLTSIIFGFVTIFLFYNLTKKIFASYTSVFASLGIFTVLFGLPIIEGNIANAENFMLLFSIGAGFLIYSLYDHQKHEANRETKKDFFRKVLISGYASKPGRLYVVAGLLLGISFLFKTVALFDLLAFVVFLYFSFKDKNIFSFFTSLFLLLTGFLFPIIGSFVYFIFHGSLGDYIDAVFRQNVSYVVLKNSFLIAPGFLFIKIILLLGIVGFVYTQRKKFSQQMLFITLWAVFSVFSAFFSGRPYSHYQLVVLPSFSLFFGYVFTRQNDYNRYVSVGGFILLSLIMYFNFNHWSVTRTIAYYKNFIAFAFHKKNIEEYQSFFDRNTPRDYMLTSYIKQHTNPKDIIFLWGNNPQVYALSDTLPPGRYTVAYHIDTFRDRVVETEQAMLRNQPKYIIIMPDQTAIPFNIQNYTYKISIDDAQVYEYANQ